MHALEIWTHNDESCEEAKYCNVIESLKYNDGFEEFVMTQVKKKTI